MEDVFKLALGVESPWFVVSTKFDLENKRLDIMLDFKRGSRFEVTCNDGVMRACPVHDTIEKTWRHLNFFQHECYLHARVPRVKTDEGDVVMVMPPWAGKLLGFTLLFEALLLQLCRHMPISQVGRITGVSDFKLWRLLDLYVDAARYSEDCSDVTAIGMDETSIAKGHDYISLFVDMNQRKTLHIAEGKGSDTVKEFAKFVTEHGGTPEQITDVSCDMSPAFIKGVAENLPKAEITFDKFHILKIINEAVDDVRREEAKTNPLLKKTRYIFLKNERNLTEKQREKKQALQVADLNLKSMEALRMRETFQQIYNAPTDLQFVELLQEWVDWVRNCGLLSMEKAAQTVASHWDGIVRWKQSQLNNGILEGLNSIIQAAKRKARGYGAKHFATIAFLLTGKLNLYNINPHLPTGNL
jgi:transposase